MTLAEIKTQFPDEWVLILVTQLGEDYETIAGEILYHHPDKKKVYQQMGEIDRDPDTTLTVEYTGEIPDDLAVML